jgi:uncharacterized membrane protein
MLEQLKNHPKVVQFKRDNPTANVIIVVIAIIAFWRGIWGLFDVVLFPNSPMLSYLSSIAIGGLVLYLDGFSLKDLKR